MHNSASALDRLPFRCTQIAGRSHLLRAAEVAGEVRQALLQQLSGRLQVLLQFSLGQTAAAVQSVWPIQSCHCSCYPSS